jgi:hypothetical protein
MLHGVGATLLVWYLRAGQQAPARPWILPALVLLSLADIVAAIGVWNWKRWGVRLYVLSTVIGIAIGLLVTASQLIVFHDIIPLAILGYLIKDKWAYFDPQIGG